MQTDFLSSPYATAIEKYLKATDNLVIVTINEHLNIMEYNDAFLKIIKSQDNLTGKNILDLLFFEYRGDNPFKDPLQEQPQRLIFISNNNTSFSLDCMIQRVGKDYLVMGGHLMLTQDQVVEKMTLLSNELINMTRELHKKNRLLEEAKAQIKVLSGIIPICSFCKEIRDDKGYWNQLEKFISENSEALFSHSACPKCMKKHYPQFNKDENLK